MMPGPVAPPPQYPPHPQAPPGYGPAYGGHPHGSAQEQWAAQQLDNARKAQKLVRLSTWMLLGGFLLMVAGCGGGIAAQVGLIALIGLGLGALVIVAAAVVGQVGRGMQGRVI